MAKYKAKGALFYCDASNPPTTLIGQMGDSTFDTGERLPLEDATCHDTSAVEDKLDVGLKSPASLVGEIIYDPANAAHESLRAAQAAGTALYGKLVLPDAGSAQWIWPGRVNKFGVGLPVKGKMTAPLSFEGTGAETFTA